jgi:exodeoxyribonuclease VII large subunit
MPVSPPGPETRVYQPGELNREVRTHLEAGFPRLWVAGEISNLARPGSGHWYFTLKDERAQLRCALFRGQRANVTGQPAHGDRVLVRGRLSLYEPRGDYQLIADAMLPAGAGALQQAFEALKAKLEREGLFDPGVKRALPGHPAAIAVVTSPTGAAIRDVLATLKRRWPAARVLVHGSPVQGEAAVPGLLDALARIERDGAAEVVLLVRGGGSLEDLWAFNDETLARRIRALPVPVVTGIGHETDFTIADFVADLRAATPTAAAEAATPDGPALRRQTGALAERLQGAQIRRLQREWQRLDGLERRLAARHPGRRLAEACTRLDALARRARRAASNRVGLAAQRLDGLERRLAGANPARSLIELRQREIALRGRLERAIRHRLERGDARLRGTARALEGVSPLAVLARGYALIEDAQGRLLTRREDFAPGQAIVARVRGGRVEAEVRRVDPDDEPGTG